MISLMSATRRIELIAAAACAALGVSGALYALFGPTISVSTETAVASDTTPGAGSAPPETVTITTDQRSMFDDGVEPGAWVVLAVMVGLSALVAVLAFVHGRSPATRRSTPLWGAAAALVSLAFITGFSVGLFLMPAALAAIVAAIAASMYRQPTPAGRHA